MKKELLITALVVIFSFGGASAQDAKEKHTAQQIYDFFAQYSPNDVVEYAAEAVKYFGKIAPNSVTLSVKEEEQVMGKALKEFNEKPRKYQWSHLPFTPSIVVQRCDEGRVVAHPIPDFFPIMSQKGFIKKYKDVKGRKIGVILCQETNEKGAWALQHQWWPLTDEPLDMGFFMIRIPGTPYEIQSFYPTQKYSEAQLKKLIFDE